MPLSNVRAQGGFKESTGIGTGGVVAGLLKRIPLWLNQRLIGIDRKTDTNMILFIRSHFSEIT